MRDDRLLPLSNPQTMAKKVTENDNKDAIGTPDTPVEKTERQVPDPETKKPEDDLSAPKTGKKPEPKIPEHADRILRTFSNYPELYIDFQGGTFTVDTPPAFRSNATLYINPYHKS